MSSPRKLGDSAQRPITIAVLALGGKGGGVLVDWIVDLAEHNGYLAQSTSVPGVAQRTGATIYYIELFALSHLHGQTQQPVLALMPVPYVDASSSAAFRSKWQRAVVGGAGIMVEVALAALAMITWTLVEPGVVQAVAFNVMLICGISTVLFNGNPLLRFDGYYVLADLVEIPNLAMRANRYLAYLAQRYLFLIPDLVSPVTARGERFWFVTYAVGSFCYRMGVTLGVALVIGNQFFFVGIALAMWTVTLGLFLPIAKGLRYVAVSPTPPSPRASSGCPSARSCAPAPPARCIASWPRSAARSPSRPSCSSSRIPNSAPRPTCWPGRPRRWNCGSMRCA